MTAQLQLARAAIDDYTGANRHEKTELIATKCRALMAGYDARWRTAGYVPIGVEETLVADLVNPDTERKSRTFRIAGKRDVPVRYGNRRILFDHKSTSEDITDPNSAYWRQLVVEGQVNHYMLLEWMHGRKFDDAIWDVIRKPSISPKKLTKKEQARIVSLGDYFSWPVSERAKKHAQDECREDLELYEIRLKDDCIAVRPERYFQRRSVPRIDAEILEYARELWGHGQDILHTRNTGRHLRNSGACMMYGTPCKFLGICSGHDTTDSDRWRRKEFVHVELPELEEDGRDILTNSRIRCYQTCRRKHFYEYEMGLERNNEEEKEALYFGSVLHAGLNSWWTYLLKENVDGENRTPASAVGRSAVESELA